MPFHLVSVDDDVFRGKPYKKVTLSDPDAGPKPMEVWVEGQLTDDQAVEQVRLMLGQRLGRLVTIVRPTAH